MTENGNAKTSFSWLGTIFLILGVGMALYHLISSQYLIFGDIQHRNVHLGFALLLVFLDGFKEARLPGRVIILLSVALILLSGIYVGVLYEELEMRSMFNTTIDLIIGVILIFLVLEGTRRAFGLALPFVAVVSIAYFFLGSYLPGILRTAAIDPGKIIAALSIGLTGLYGVALSVSASYIFLFVILGAILQVSGAPRFFMELGKLAGRGIRSGPAMSSVVTSALLGTMTGSIGANIITTGSFTIPLMKSVGYKPEQAAAIEAAASNGGQIMPPVMGAAAFAMAAITGFSYLIIIMAALIPSLFYFAVVGLYAQLQAMKLGISPKVETVENKELILRAPLFVVPLGLIIYLLSTGKPLMFCAFWAILSCMALSLLRKETRPSLKVWVKAFAKGAVTGGQIGVACACLGLILETLTGTGMGVKLPVLVETWTGGVMLIGLVITAAVSIILGMGVSTIGVYLLVAMVTAPILIKMGIGLLQTHFFVFFFAVFAMVTPPVGMGSIIASKVAKARYLPTGIEAVKVSLAGFILPFLIIWNPELLLLPSGLPFTVVLMRLTVCGVLLLALETSIVGYYILRTRLWERLLLAVSGIALFVYFSADKRIFLAAGLVIFVGMTLQQLFRRGMLKAQTV